MTRPGVAASTEAGECGLSLRAAGETANRFVPVVCVSSRDAGLSIFGIPVPPPAPSPLLAELFRAFPSSSSPSSSSSSSSSSNSGITVLNEALGEALEDQDVRLPLLCRPTLRRRDSESTFDSSSGASNSSASVAKMQENVRSAGQIT